MVITTIAMIILDTDCDNVKNYDNCNHNHTRKKIIVLMIITTIVIMIITIIQRNNNHNDK